MANFSHYSIFCFEWFSNDCRETKTNVIKTDATVAMNQSELEASTCSQCRQRESASEQLVTVLLLIAWESGAHFTNQSQSEVKQNDSKYEIAFDSQVKTLLSHESINKKKRKPAKGLFTLLVYLPAGTAHCHHKWFPLHPSRNSW